MAFDNQGADWLQWGEQINNPYFGASMLRCGEIRASFEPIDADAMNGASGAMEGHNHE
jgi:Cu(I)/Ag(I) efflux system membrane fusion protein